VFAGWFMDPRFSEEELQTGSANYRLWQLLVRFIAAPAIAIILVTGLL
jgi:hypothetical protein